MTKKIKNTLFILAVLLAPGLAFFASTSYAVQVPAGNSPCSDTCSSNGGSTPTPAAGSTPAAASSGSGSADATTVPCHPEQDTPTAGKPLNSTKQINGFTQLSDCEFCQSLPAPDTASGESAEEQVQECSICHPSAGDPPGEPLSEKDYTSCTDCNNADKSLQDCLDNNKIIIDINGFVDFLSAAAGLVIIGSIILGGIQYSIAGDSPEATGKAKNRIIHAVMALAVFLFIFAFLQWLIPGGIFK